MPNPIKFEKLRRLIPKAMRSDRHALNQEYNRIQRILQSDTASKTHEDRIHRLRARILDSVYLRKRRMQTVPEIRYNEQLPIFEKKDNIIDAISRNRVVVISGETGSGKTTQIPKFCLAAGRGIDGMIGCTQPRRIAAMTVAGRIAEELGQELGRSIGYKIRFTDKTSQESHIKIMTDGVLLAEAQGDRFLNDYDTIIVDEAHERSLNIDFVLGIIKNLLFKRKDLKLIITSATIDKEKFSRAFFDAPVIEVSGRMYPVEVRYFVDEHDNSGDGEEETHVEMAVRAVWKLHRDTRVSGGILVFMPTEQDIRETCEILNGRLDDDKTNKNATVFPLYARMPASEQGRIFGTCRGRMIIVATNIAETSITIPGIQYVVDTGLARISQYSPRTRTTSLPVAPVSMSSADQRKGRCGRVRDGICVRLFSESDYLGRPRFTLPEILRSNLAEVILRMIALKLGDVERFPFIDSPNPKQIRDGFDMLVELGAITMGRERPGKTRLPKLTQKGLLMSKMPLDPRLSRMLIEAEAADCLAEMTIIAAALSIQDPRERPAEKAEAADSAHADFKHPESDFLTLLRIWNRYHQLRRSEKSHSKIKKFCKARFLSYRRMREWCDIHNQIKGVLLENNIRLPSDPLVDIPEKRIGDYRYTAVHRCITCGFLSNIAVKKDKNLYTAAKNREAMIFPGSGLFNTAGTWVVAAEMVETSRLFARTVATIDSEWIETLGGEQLRFTYSDPHWERKRGEVMAKEQVSLYGLIIVQGRPARYGPVDPDHANDIFIRSVLIQGDLARPFRFMRRNLNMIDEIKQMEDKIRRRDVLIGDEEMYSFYKERLPGVYDIRTLKKILKEKGEDFLVMNREELLRYEPGRDRLALYPDQVSLGNVALPCDYRFNPGMPDDGVTVWVSSDKVSLLKPESLDWIAPGLLNEKITALIKGLPKTYRKQLVPVNETVSIILKKMTTPKAADLNEGSLISKLSRFINDHFGVDIPASAWPLKSLPEHLKMRVAVTGPGGEVVRAGRDRSVLSGKAMESRLPEGFDHIRGRYERENITDWDFGDIPESTVVETRSGASAVCYLRLNQNASGVGLKLFADHRKAAAAHKKGVAALFSTVLSKDLRFLKKAISIKGNAANRSGQFSGKSKIEAHIFDGVVKTLFEKDIRTRKAFYDHAQTASGKLLEIGKATTEKAELVLDAWSETRTILERSRFEYRKTKPIVDFLNELEKSLSELVPEQFAGLYDLERMEHIARYIRAIGIRAERGVLNFDKETAKAEDLKHQTGRLDRLIETLDDDSSEEKQAAVEEFRWMVEEYKVSLFAQELKTSVPVSPKRMTQKYKEIERMI